MHTQNQLLRSHESTLKEQLAQLSSLMTDVRDITKAIIALHADIQARFQHKRRLSGSPFNTSGVHNELRKGSPSLVEGSTTLHSGDYSYNASGISHEQSRDAQTHLIKFSATTAKEYQHNAKCIQISPIAEILGQNNENNDAQLDPIEITKKMLTEDLKFLNNCKSGILPSDDRSIVGNFDRREYKQDQPGIKYLVLQWMQLCEFEECALEESD